MLNLLLAELESDAASQRQTPRDDSAWGVYYGRVDALLRVGMLFGFWDNRTMKKLATWVKQPRGRTARQVLGLPEA